MPAVPPNLPMVDPVLLFIDLIRMGNCHMVYFPFPSIVNSTFKYSYFNHLKNLGPRGFSSNPLNCFFFLPQNPLIGYFLKTIVSRHMRIFSASFQLVHVVPGCRKDVLLTINRSL